jgi:drug/metabolite transporter (DMT)-like permease
MFSFSAYIHLFKKNLQMSSIKKRYLTDLSLFFIAVIWALNFTVIKASLSEIDPYSFNAIRFVLAALFLWFIVFYNNATFSIPVKDWIPLIILGLAGNLLYQWLFIIGIDLTLAANAAIMLGTIPIWVALGSHFFSIELMNRLKSIGVFFAFAGVLLIITTGKNPVSVGSDTFRGDVLIVLAAIILGFYTIFSKSFLTRYSPLQFSAFMTTLGAVCLVLLAIPHFHRTDWADVSAAAYGGVFYSGMLAIGLAYLIWNSGLHHVGAVRTVMYQNLVPVLGLLFGIVLLGESLEFWQYIGSGVVIAGILFTRYGGRV